jgi:hypothetical protein
MAEFIIKDPNLIQKLDQLNEKELDKLSEVLEEEIPKLHVYQTTAGILRTPQTLQASQMTELAKRAVACVPWRWMPGMLTTCGVRVIEGRYDYLIGHRQGATKDGGGWVDTGDAIGFLPDLTDPATIGCLLDLVRYVWYTAPANVNSHTSYSPEKGHYRYWICSYCTCESWEQTQGETEAEALVIALERAE